MNLFDLLIDITGALSQLTELIINDWSTFLLIISGGVIITLIIAKLIRE